MADPEAVQDKEQVSSTSHKVSRTVSTSHATRSRLPDASPTTGSINSLSLPKPKTGSDPAIKTKNSSPPNTSANSEKPSVPDKEDASESLFSSMTSKVGNFLQENIVKPVSNVASQISSGLKTVKDTVVETASKGVDLLNKYIVEPASNLGSTIMSGLKTAKDAVVETASKVGDFLHDNIVTPVSDFVSDTWHSISDTFSNFGRSAGEMWDSTTSFLGNLWNNTGGALIDKVADTFGFGKERGFGSGSSLSSTNSGIFGDRSGMGIPAMVQAAVEQEWERREKRRRDQAIYGTSELEPQDGANGMLFHLLPKEEQERQAAPGSRQRAQSLVRKNREERAEEARMAQTVLSLPSQVREQVAEILAEATRGASVHVPGPSGTKNSIPASTLYPEVNRILNAMRAGLTTGGEIESEILNFKKDKVEKA